LQGAAYAGGAGCDEEVQGGLFCRDWRTGALIAKSIKKADIIAYPELGRRRAKAGSREFSDYSD